jgi:hypothetical protein
LVSFLSASVLSTGHGASDHEWSRIAFIVRVHHANAVSTQQIVDLLQIPTEEKHACAEFFAAMDQLSRG